MSPRRRLPGARLGEKAIRRRPGSEPPRPALRYMTVIAQDPSVKQHGSRAKILMAKIAVPAEKLDSGPKGYRVQVVDYDASTRRFRGDHQLPASLDAEPARWQRGDAKIVEDRAFHAQNVYALVMKTLSRFELALGRRVGWSFGRHQIKVAPQGMKDANAFYSRQDEGLVFGYFEGLDTRTVYTCLSHDVVVHETTHALIDGLRERYLDPSSPDQAAFHEGLADVVALLSVFSQPEIIRALLLPRDAKGAGPALIAAKDVAPERLRDSALFGLAEQMGREIQGARGEALRQSAKLAPDDGLIDLPEFNEPHRRGELLVAAIMNGFIETWAARIRQLGVPGQSRYTVNRVAEEGADVAEALATMWIRALDYMPPVHLEFHDALTAALTADAEVRPDDSRFDLRRQVRASFLAYGIATAPRANPRTGTWKRAPGRLSYDRVRSESMRNDKDEVFRFLWENQGELEIDLDAYTEVISVRPCLRLGLDGFALRETVAEYYQVARLTPDELAARDIHAPREWVKAMRRRPDDGADDGAGDGRDDDATLPIYGGGVLIFDEYGRLKYHVTNRIFSTRQTQRLRYLWESGQLTAGRDRGRLRPASLSTIHRLRATDARSLPQESW